MALKFNMLVVDNDADLVRTLTKILRSRWGDRFEIEGLTDTAIAVKYCETNCCHVLISDLDMPGFDGLELMRVAKRRNPWTQVVVVTPHPTRNRLSSAIETGASDYLLKPIDQKDLAVVLDQTYARLIRWQLAIQGSRAPSPAAI